MTARGEWLEGRKEVGDVEDGDNGTEPQDEVDPGFGIDFIEFAVGFGFWGRGKLGFWRLNGGGHVLIGVGHRLIMTT